LRPVLNYIQKDLEHMIETFEWKWYLTFFIDKKVSKKARPV
jgi:hypothetical protein